MLEAARLAPSGSNSQPWRFVVVKDQAVRGEISRLHFGQLFLSEAPVNIVCFAALDRYSKEAGMNKWDELVRLGIAETLTGRAANKEYWDSLKSLPEPSREQMLLKAVSNAYIAIEHMLLMATALGVGPCWAGAVDVARLNRLFDLPETLVSVAVVAVGYPAGEIPAPRPRITMEQMVLNPQVQLASPAVEQASVHQDRE